MWKWIPLVIAFASPLWSQSNVAFAPEVYRARRAKLAAALEEGSLAIVPAQHLIGQRSWGPIEPDPNFWYLTGVETVYGALVVSAERTALFLPEEFQFAGGQYPMADFEAFRRARWNRPGAWRLHPSDEAKRIIGIDQIYPVDAFAKRLDAIAAEAKSVYLPLRRREMYAPEGLDAPRSVYAQMVDAIRERLSEKQIRDLSPILDALRLIKDEHEIEALRKAAEISGLGLIEAMKRARPGMTTLELSGLMEAVWKREGSPRPAFATIVRSGPDMTFFTLANEQYFSTDHVMKDGHLVFADYGAAEYRTYTSDLCRTFPANGKFTPEQRKYYDIVEEAHLAAIAAVKPDAMLLDAVKAAARVFQKHGLQKFEDIEEMGADNVWGMMPSPTHYLDRDAGIVPRVRALGHFIGLQVSDPRDYRRPLEPGMVFTVEPKLYIPEKGISIMIEDMVLVTETGHENLSPHAPTDADEIERLMAAAR